YRCTIVLSSRPLLRSLFFSCYGDLLVLHSFPTRRSSDLSFYYLFGEANLKKSIENLGFGLDDITDVFLTHLHFDHCGGAVIYDKDRKSTRLNSSHVKISYAVFCLKKKTTDYQTAPGHTAA